MKKSVVFEYGNNAQPIQEGRCCDECSLIKVIPEKIRLMSLKDKESKAKAGLEINKAVQESKC